MFLQNLKRKISIMQRCRFALNFEKYVKLITIYVFYVWPFCFLSGVILLDTGNKIPSLKSREIYCSVVWQTDKHAVKLVYQASMEQRTLTKIQRNQLSW